ncbi:hypothetical protein DPMN_064802 [Dreissena polymorpha]|uniref:Uncharacterized protein n=1 Tax=Dreissena polymorpha TaxID=45954 RepID=A0A9D4CDT7_DREPO|nr:hypothetical protein DPMN_064802 [Dreissena polymorpha]
MDNKELLQHVAVLAGQQALLGGQVPLLLVRRRRRRKKEDSPGLAGCGLGCQRKEGCNLAIMTDLWQN